MPTHENWTEEEERIAGEMLRLPEFDEAAFARVTAGHSAAAIAFARRTIEGEIFIDHATDMSAHACSTR